MNMNMNLNLDFKKLKFSPEQIKKVVPLIVGVGLIALFAYTGLTIRQAITALPDDSQATAATVTKFDKQTIASIKKLTVVSGQTDISNLGTTSPFGQ